MPTDPLYPSRHRMWRGVTAAYVVIAVLIFPLAIGGYWAYGNMVCSTSSLVCLRPYYPNSSL